MWSGWSTKVPDPLSGPLEMTKTELVFPDNLGKSLCSFCKVKFSRLIVRLKCLKNITYEQLSKNTYPELSFL